MSKYIKRTMQETKLEDPAVQIPNFVQPGDTILFWGVKQTGWGIADSKGATLCLQQQGFQLDTYSWKDLVDLALEMRVFGEKGKRLVHAIRPGLGAGWAGRMLQETGDSIPFPEALQGTMPKPEGQGKVYLTLDQEYWLWGASKEKKCQEKSSTFWVRLGVDRIRPFWVPMQKQLPTPTCKLRMVSREFFCLFFPKSRIGLERRVARCCGIL